MRGNTAYRECLTQRRGDISGLSHRALLECGTGSNHTAQVKGVLPDLVKIVGGDPKRVMSFADFDGGGIGVRTTGREKTGVPRYDVLGHYAQLAAEGRFSIPIARTYKLEDWREAAQLSMNKQAHGKLILLPGSGTGA